MLQSFVGVSEPLETVVTAATLKTVEGLIFVVDVDVVFFCEEDL